MSEEERPKFKTSIRNHPVYCDDEDAREYLRELDHDEVDMIFDRARTHGHAEFEIELNNVRHNYSMQYDAGAYIVIHEGKESSGWF